MCSSPTHCEEGSGLLVSFIVSDMLLFGALIHTMCEHECNSKTIIYTHVERLYVHNMYIHGKPCNLLAHGTLE